jgi:hypothetical protein
MRAVQIRTLGEPGIVLELADLPEPPASNRCLQRGPPAERASRQDRWRAMAPTRTVEVRVDSQ